MKLCWLVVLLIIAAPFQSSAAPCVSAPLTTYTSAGFSCEVDSAVFSNFSFFLQNGGAGNVLSEGEITVAPIVEPDIFGLRFSGAFQATGGPNGPGVAEGIRVNAYRFFWDVTRPGSLITSVGARLNDPFRFAPNPLKFGDIFAANLAANDAALAIVHDDDPDLTEVDPLNTNRVFVTADNLIQLAAGASAAGTVTPVGYASLDSADFFYTHEVVIPEPSAWLLCATGLALVILRARRQVS